MSIPESSSIYDLRAADWRNGALVYQVFVDRFAPPADLEAKRGLYAAPRRLRAWSELPARGEFLPEVGVWSHELDFWGGDLQSLRSRLDYITDLGMDVLYLNPIHAALTNHKYDATDYLQISPEYGTWADLQALIDDTHRCGLRLVLDGVFNHVGLASPLYREAAADPHSPHRDWFYFGDQFPYGVRLWANAPNHPELNFENPAVCDYIYVGSDSVVRTYLRAGIDGWRLDTAFELGYHYLDELTRSAHTERPGSLVVGEIWNYPSDWMPAVDATMNFPLREILLQAANGRLPAGQANQMIATMIRDTGIEPLLKSWIVLDNHDTARLADTIPDLPSRRVAQLLQFTLPGSPNLYYASELDLPGPGDPENRAPMPWEQVKDANPALAWTKKLIHLRKAQRALKIGDCCMLGANQLIAFERFTDRVEETLVVAANFSDHEVEEFVLVPDARLMNYTLFEDLLGSGATFRLQSALLPVRLPARSALVLQPQIAPLDGYTPYKRID